MIIVYAKISMILLSMNHLKWNRNAFAALYIHIFFYRCSIGNIFLDKFTDREIIIAHSVADNYVNAPIKTFLFTTYFYRSVWFSFYLFFFVIISTDISYYEIRLENILWNCDKAECLNKPKRALKKQSRKCVRWAVTINLFAIRKSPTDFLDSVQKFANFNLFKMKAKILSNIILRGEFVYIPIWLLFEPF